MIDINQDKKRVFIETYGCQMNEYDSELLRSILKKAGYTFTNDETIADVILLNTCSVRDKATRSVFGLIHRIRHDRQERPAIYGILGCMATNLKEELINDPHLNINLVAGPDSYKRLPQLIEQAQEKNVLDIELSDDEVYEDIYPDRKSSANAWIAIMRGCNNFCSYCVVPYTRGRERSRSPKSIINETRRLVDEGFAQVTLLGQNVNSYSYRDVQFPHLLSDVAKVEGLKRIWFTSPHPKDVADELIDLIAENPRICKHIHLPLQAGSNEILRKMNRPYTQEHYLNLVDKIRLKCPQIAITTDIIVGFPNESDKDFLDTINVFQTVGYDSAFIFKYSPRPETQAAKNLADDVPDEVKTQRIVFLNQLQQKFALEANQKLIGSTQDILIETVRKEKVEGRTIHNKRVVLQSDPVPPNPKSLEKSKIQEDWGTGKLGRLIKVSITSATPHLLKGEAQLTH